MRCLFIVMSLIIFSWTFSVWGVTCVTDVNGCEKCYDKGKLISTIGCDEPWSCGIFTTEDSIEDEVINYDKELETVVVDTKSPSVLWRESNIVYTIAPFSSKLINFVVADISEAVEDPKKVKSLVNVALPIDQDKFLYIDHVRQLSFECSRE